MITSHSVSCYLIEIELFVRVSWLRDVRTQHSKRDNYFFVASIHFLPANAWDRPAHGSLIVVSVKLSPARLIL